MSEEGLTFKPHTIETEDGYLLTLLHVTKDEHTHNAEVDE